MSRLTSNDHVKRLIACLFGGFVLSLMVGNQEGGQNDFGIAFSQATRTPRLLAFLLIGVGIYLVVTFWPYLQPYLRRPGAMAVIAGFLAVLVAMVLMHWYDPVGKFGPVADAVSKTPNIPTLAGLFFSWFAWALWLVWLVVGIAGFVTRQPLIGWALAVGGVLSAILCFVAHQQLVSFATSHGSGPDHSLGVFVATAGYLAYALAGVIIARSTAPTAQPRETFERAMEWRPGLGVALIGVLLGLVAFFDSSWLAPLALNRSFSQLGETFQPTTLGGLWKSYNSWLGLTLFFVLVVVALVSCALRLRILGWVVAAAGLAGIVLTFFDLRGMTEVAAKVAPNLGPTWQNLGSGGFAGCIAFGLLGTAGYLAASASRPAEQQVPAQEDVVDPVDKLPVRAAVRRSRASTALRALPPIVLLFALFYPPTMTVTWQNVLVTQIGVYILLTVGLNVVVGWAGLLDLGYIAFYGIGSYTTAYICGSLPVKPPSWLQLSPLWAIPFAVVACLIAGVLLGAPTLRLRGDYLAIVTLGFGEIIQIIAINADGVTGGPQGPSVPHPVLDLGFAKVTWGLDNLPYWYLLVVMIVVMVVLFYRLEGSRIGRAWAAIREDEVAAQATGINTTRVKLLAFAIGASTSGLAGVFFATQVGYFDPSGFTLQNSILIVAYVVFGGMGSLPGAIAGAAVLTWLPQFLKDQVPLDDRQMWIGGIVLAMMIFRPAGLIPAKRRKAELSHVDGGASPDTRAVPVGEGL